MRISDAVAAFIEHCQKDKNLSPFTIRAYRSDLKIMISSIEAPRIDEQALKNYFSSLSDISLFKPASIKRKIIVARCFFRWWKGSKSPMAHLSTSFPPSKRLPRIASLVEVRSLLDALVSKVEQAKTDYAAFAAKRNLALIELLVSTGLRIGEAASLNDSDIDLIERTVLTHGKGNRERMLYVSSNESLERISSYLVLKKKIFPSAEAVFLSKTGQPISVRSCEVIFAKAKIEAGITSSITPHYLRHTFASTLLSNGADIRSVQELLGHASVVTTEIYTEVSLTRKKEVLQKYNYRNGLFSE